VIEGAAEGNASVRPIADYLDSSRTAAPVFTQDRGPDSYAGGDVQDSDELPPVEHFLDPLPVVERFAPDAEGALSEAWPSPTEEIPTNGGRGASEALGTAWGETDWQQYDWRGAAALGETADEASNAWAATDWDGSVPRARDLRQTAAHAIASALDQIAAQIREGELSVPGPGGTTDPAKIAATLAALLGVKR